MEESIKVDQLKEALEEIFSEFGNVLEIVAKANLKAKGQAFIVYDSVEAATRAIDEANGFDLFEKPMVLDYAKTRSDATVMREGGSDELEAHKRKRLAEKGISLLSPQILFSLTRAMHADSHFFSSTQSVGKPMMRLKHRRSSSAPPPLRFPTTHARPKPQRALVSSPHLVAPLLLCQTNISLPTKFCSCGIWQMMLAKRVFRRCSVVLRDSRKSDWCQVVRVLHS